MQNMEAVMKKLVLCSAAALLCALGSGAHAVPPTPAPQPAPQSAPEGAASTTTTTTTTTGTGTVAPKAGDLVYDNTGQQAGSVDSVNGNTVVVATAEGKGSMPLTEFAMGEKGLMMNHTKAELEMAIRNAKAPQGPAADGEAPKAPSR
jgi:hypothetical protein